MHSESRYVFEEKLAQNCFQVPFAGTAHEQLHDQLVKHRISMTRATHYSPYCALVQSSGTGKSRALMELSELGVYVCYCSLASYSSTAFPPRTGGLADRLVSTFTEHGMVLYLNAWLRVLAAHISTMSPEIWKQQQLPGCPESDLAKKVVNEWRKLSCIDDTDGLDNCNNPDVWNTDYSSEAIKSVENALQQCKKCTCSEKECPHTLCRVIFAFDEARGLQGPYPASRSMMIASPFYQISRALRIFFEHRAFGAIMLDTSARIIKWLPSREDEDSMRRAISMGLKLAHPIYFLPNMSLFKATATQEVPDCLTPEHWLKQGRPMWSARLEKEGCPFTVRTLALQKLVRTVCGLYEEKGVPVPVNLLNGVMTESQAMALLSATAGLSICARSELAAAMSASHMHLILRVSEDRSRIFIGLPAEPILAEGAADVLMHSVVQEGALKHLLAACEVGYVTPGPRGEFVAKFILVAATWKKDEKWQLRQIPLEEYLRRLLANGDGDESTLDKVKANYPQGGRVFFNSFVQVRKPPTTRTLYRAFTSGYALMYREENLLIIPVWTLKGMTCIVVSVQDLPNCGWLEKVSRSELVEEGLICITVVMSLGEPSMKGGDPWLLRLSADATDPAINLTCFGIDRNYGYLTGEVKELLKEVLFTVPDELAGATDEQKQWIQQSLPEQYLD